MTEPMTDADLAEMRNMLARSHLIEGEITGWVDDPVHSRIDLGVFDVADLRALDERLRRAEALLAEVAKGVRRSFDCVAPDSMHAHLVIFRGWLDSMTPYLKETPDA